MLHYFDNDTSDVEHEQSCLKADARVRAVTTPETRWPSLEEEVATLAASHASFVRTLREDPADARAAIAAEGLTRYSLRLIQCEQSCARKEFYLDCRAGVRESDFAAVVSGSVAVFDWDRTITACEGFIFNEDDWQRHVEGFKHYFAAPEAFGVDDLWTLMLGGSARRRMVTRGLASVLSRCGRSQVYILTNNTRVTNIRSMVDALAREGGFAGGFAPQNVLTTNERRDGPKDAFIRRILEASSLRLPVLRPVAQQGGGVVRPLATSAAGCDQRAELAGAQTTTSAPRRVRRKLDRAGPLPPSKLVASAASAAAAETWSETSEQ